MWLRRFGDVNSAKCVFCKKVFTLSGMGRQSVKSHQGGKLHRKLVAMMCSSSVSMSSSLTQPLYHQEPRGIINSSPQKQHAAHQHPISCPLEHHHAVQRSKRHLQVPLIKLIFWETVMLKGQKYRGCCMLFQKDSFNIQF
ncbi:hypothetical protein PR048_021089 [Dryococelus australis]|uniref:BED-type domain-containing protein n=1 Tax=Dryococelus australis TaxID=614101 RepID=A0ABQ9GXB7_9NEOP|nr:hypothetical protein PR048_021089 [Dryococelus australis]